MVLAGCHDAASAGMLDLVRAEDGRFVRIEVLGANPAGQAIPASGCELQFLAERRVRQFGRRDAQRLFSFVPRALVERHLRLCTIHVETPILVHLS